MGKSSIKEENIMKFSFLEVLEDGYSDARMTFLENDGENVKECDEFYSKYIEPVFAENWSQADEFESDFTTAIVKQKEQSFQDGFKACMQMLIECTSKKAAKS